MAADISIASSPVGARLRWLLHELDIPGWDRGAPGGRSRGSADEAFVENGGSAVAALARQLADYRVVAVEEADETDCTLVLQSGPLRRSTLRVTVEADRPHRIRHASVTRTLPEGTYLRPATPEDGRELAELCRQTPILLSNGRQLVIDPGDDYWTGTRLMGMANALVAVHGERIIAVQLGTMFEARYGGRHQRVAVVLHTRVHPDFAMAGIRTVIQRVFQQVSAQRMQQAQHEAGVTEPDRGDRSDRATPPTAPLALTGISYVAAENLTTQSDRIRAASWKCKPYRLVLPCPLPRATDHGRVATAADGPRIVELINRCHGEEELFLPYTERYLEERLSRAPDLYTWGDLLLGENAVVGVWMSGERRVLTDGGTTTTSVRGLVLDHGFAPGHEDELLLLLGAASRRAAGRGMTHLSVFSSDGSPGAASLRSVAETIERYEVVNPFHPEPAGTVDRGMWVDQIYF